MTKDNLFVRIVRQTGIRLRCTPQRNRCCGRCMYPLWAFGLLPVAPKPRPNLDSQRNRLAMCFLASTYQLHAIVSGNGGLQHFRPERIVKRPQVTTLPPFSFFLLQDRPSFVCFLSPSQISRPLFFSPVQNPPLSEYSSSTLPLILPLRQVFSYSQHSHRPSPRTYVLFAPLFPYPRGVPSSSHSQPRR